jgi:cyanuric acid amidohydrolase
MTRRAFVHRISTKAPDDVSGLRSRIALGEIDPRGIVAILGKTEGNGNVNDFSRGFASASLKIELRRHLSQADADAICLVMSGGTEGAMAPHVVVFEVRDVADAPEASALAVGRSRTADLPFEQLGRIAQIELVADAVRAAMADAGIAEADQVHFVQIKCPLLTLERIARAESEGKQTATRDTLKSMALSRAASSLGVATALGEVDPAAIRDEAIGRDWSLFSSRASASAGVELTDHEIVVLGHAPGWSGPLRIAHCVMQDAIDVEPVRAALALQPGTHLVALLGKAESGTSGKLRGYRHTMLDDSDISPTRHARGFVAGALAGVVGHAEIYVSGGAEHQGPDGGGPVALITTEQAIKHGVAA